MSNAAFDKMAVENEARRCAVFKIDLTGRFVFIDERTEKLFKLPIESIFGRNIQDFLDKESYKTIQNIMNHSRLYETFYESAELVFIDSSKRPYKRTAVVSLNFIGGNPANYQVVVSPERAVEEKIQESATGEPNQIQARLFKYLTDLRGKVDWKDLIAILLEDVNVIQAGIYQYKKDGLTRLASDSDPLYAQKGVDLTATDENHAKTAKYNMPYISEGEGKLDGLTDACFPLVCADESWGLLRLVVKDEFIPIADKLKRYADFISNAFYGLCK